MHVHAISDFWASQKSFVLELEQQVVDLQQHLLVYMKRHTCFYWLCISLPPQKVAELEQQVTDLEQQLHDCEDTLDHYQNIVSLKLR